MRIVILGAGAVGGYFGGMLAKAEDVVFMARGERLEAMRSRGLTIRKPDATFTLPVQVSDRPVKADVLLVCVKTYDTDAACEPWKGSGVAVVTLQNGLGNRDRLSRHFPADSIVEGVAY